MQARHSGASRALCDGAEEDDLIEAIITLSDELTLETRFKSLPDYDGTAYIISVAKLAGFTVSREGHTLFFSAKSQNTSFMKIYATSKEIFADLLITTYKM